MRNVSGEVLSVEQAADLLERSKVEKTEVIDGAQATWLSEEGGGSSILVQGMGERFLLLR